MAVKIRERDGRLRTHARSPWVTVRSFTPAEVILGALIFYTGCATAAVSLPPNAPTSPLQRAQLDIRPTIPVYRAGLPPHVVDLGYGLCTCEQGYFLFQHRCVAEAELPREQVVVVSDLVAAPSADISTVVSATPLPIEQSPLSAGAPGWFHALSGIESEAEKGGGASDSR
jgi:hypothetical protein